MTARLAYDAVPYDTEANPEAHPRSMAALARLFGIEGAPPSTARVLEIGCGDGEHMLAAASYLPRARFVGFDLAKDAIARGADAARDANAANVTLLHRDVCDVGRAGLEDGSDGVFDYVVAHGVYSWVPEAVRADVLGVIRGALAPAGLGFISVNATPGWELRRSLRDLMREVAAQHADPGGQVRAALALVDDLAAARGDGFVGVLAKAANEYRAHVAQATPPDAPFCRYVFHDLLAECSDPFSVTELDARLRAAGLRIVCETPLRPARAGGEWPGLAAEMARSGHPFLQVLVCRDDAGAGLPREVDLSAVRTMQLWADLAPAGPGAYRTTTGAVLRASGDTGLVRAVKAAPGFVPVTALADDADSLAVIESDLWITWCRGLLSLVTEAAPICARSAAPRVAAHVRLRAREAVARRAATAVLTSAMHRSFRVPLRELAVVQELDGGADVEELVRRVAKAVESDDEGARKLVETVLDRFARHGFIVGDGVGA